MEDFVLFKPKTGKNIDFCEIRPIGVLPGAVLRDFQSPQKIKQKIDFRVDDLNFYSTTPIKHISE